MNLSGVKLKLHTSHSNLQSIVQTRALRIILTSKVGREPYQSCYGLDPLRDHAATYLHIWGTGNSAHVFLALG